MDGVALSEFADFVMATGPHQLRGPKGLINSASQNTYVYARHLDGRYANKKMIAGGSRIEQQIFFDGNGTFEWYQSGARGNWKNPQRLMKMQAFWRQNRVHMAWTDNEILFNEKIMAGGDEARFQQFTDLRNAKEAYMWTEKWEGLENSLAATPNALTMEGEGPEFIEPYSIMAHINEDANGLWGSDWGTAPAGAFSTIMGIDPTATRVKGRFQPARKSYTSAAGGNVANIIAAFDDIFQDVHFESPTMHRQYFEELRYRKFLILTSKRGRSIYIQLLRNSQDRLLAGGQDPNYPNPTFAGVPVTRWSQFENGAYYEPASGATPATEFAADNKGPRYLLINTQYQYPVFHKERYFYKDSVSRHHEVPDTWVCPVSTYCNFINTHRRMHGIVHPVGAIYSA